MIDTSQPEKAFGFDAPRYFSNQIQILRSDNAAMTLMLFREIANVVMPDEPDKPTVEIGKTVAGMILPTDTVIGLRDVLNTLFPVNTQESKADGQSA
jgi:hypothetical protein